jgi:hypothetical protein
MQHKRFGCVWSDKAAQLEEQAVGVGLRLMARLPPQLLPCAPPRRRPSIT